MLVKKLAVPLVNEKILQQAEHCYIVTSHLTEAGFEFVRSRIPAKTKIDIVTGLDELTDPLVLRRILTNYQGRINLYIYTRNIVHANLYIFDLPFRKSVAFVGSGSLSLEGLKDHEELFWKIINPKEIESLMSWYTTYFQFGVPLNENIALTYEKLFPEMKKRKILSAQEKDELIKSTTSSFNLASIRFRNQFFQKEHFETFSIGSAGFDNAALRLSRMAVQQKLSELKGGLNSVLQSLKWKEVKDALGLSIELKDRESRKISSLFYSFMPEASPSGPWTIINLGISHFHIFIQLEVKGGAEYKRQRERLHEQLELETFRQTFWSLLTSLAGFTVEVCGVQKPLDFFPDVKAFRDHLKGDTETEFSIVFQRSFSPGDAALSADSIHTSIEKVMVQLNALVTLFGKI